MMNRIVVSSKLGGDGILKVTYQKNILTVKTIKMINSFMLLIESGVCIIIFIVY